MFLIAQSSVSVKFIRTRLSDISPSYLKQTATIELKDDADNVHYDAVSRRFWVGYGDGRLAALDPESGRQVADVIPDAHHEFSNWRSKASGFSWNVPNAGYVAVVDRETGTVIVKFSLKEAVANFPMALDEANRRVLIGGRNPEKLLVLDMELFARMLPPFLYPSMLNHAECLCRSYVHTLNPCLVPLALTI